MPTENIGATSDGVSKAAARLSDLLSSEPPPKEEEPTDTQDDDPKNSPEAEEEDSGQSAEEESQETSDDDTEGEETKYKVKVNGEELEITLDEALNGYMREASFRHKTHELAAERKKIEEAHDRAKNRVAEAESLLSAEIEDLNSKEVLELKEDDPEAYVQLLDRVQAKREKLEQLKNKLSAKDEDRKQKLIQNEQKALLDMFPQWSDSSVMQREAADLFSTLKTFGFSDGELSEVTDHRLFVLADKARQLELIQSKVAQVKQSKPKSKPSMKPGSATSTEQAMSEEAKRHRETLKRSGKVSDAVRLLSM